MAISMTKLSSADYYLDRTREACISSSRCFVLGLVPFCWTRR